MQRDGGDAEGRFVACVHEGSCRVGRQATLSTAGGPTGGGIVAFLDDDAVPADEWLEPPVAPALKQAGGMDALRERASAFLQHAGSN